MRTVRVLFTKPVFEKGKANCISEIASVFKQHNNKNYDSIKTAPIQACKGSNGKVIISKFQDKRK